MIKKFWKQKCVYALKLTTFGHKVKIKMSVHAWLRNTQCWLAWGFICIYIMVRWLDLTKITALYIKYYPSTYIHLDFPHWKPSNSLTKLLFPPIVTLCAAPEHWFIYSILSVQMSGSTPKFHNWRYWALNRRPSVFKALLLHCSYAGSLFTPSSWSCSISIY